VIEKLAIQSGILGSALGILAGLIELSIGAQIRPWIGNKENPAVLGLVTLLLSGMALMAVMSARKLETPTSDSKLTIFLGVFLPAVICFTTVGRLWYLPGPLLIGTALLLAYEYWVSPSLSGAPETFSNTEWVRRIIGGIGSVTILTSVGMAFWKSQFGLFQSEVLGNAERIRIQVLPMDFVRRIYLSGSMTTVEDIEVSQVMIVYLLLILGAGLAFIASLTASRLFIGIGSAIVLTGLLIYLVWLPGILAQAQYTSEGLLNLIGSLGWGWHISTTGMSLTLIASLFRLGRG
jgi:hypothetical protein